MLFYFWSVCCITKCVRRVKFLVSLVCLMNKYNVPYERIFSKCWPYKMTNKIPGIHNVTLRTRSLWWHSHSTDSKQKRKLISIFCDHGLKMSYRLLGSMRKEIPLMLEKSIALSFNVFNNIRDEESSTYEKQAMVILTVTLPGIRAFGLQALCRPKQASLLCQKWFSYVQ